jgi:hypothetical protein
MEIPIYTTVLSFSGIRITSDDLAHVGKPEVQYVGLDSIHFFGIYLCVIRMSSLRWMIARIMRWK